MNINAKDQYLKMFMIKAAHVLSSTNNTVVKLCPDHPRTPPPWQFDVDSRLVLTSMPFLFLPFKNHSLKYI